LDSRALGRRELRTFRFFRFPSATSTGFDLFSAALLVLRAVERSKTQTGHFTDEILVGK